MNRARQAGISKIVDLVQEIHTNFFKGSRGCSFECRSIMYGALTQEMESNGLLSPEFMHPFPGTNYNELVRKVRSFNSPQWYDSPSYGSYHSRYQHKCEDSSFASLFSGLTDSIVGLDLLMHIS